MSYFDRYTEKKILDILIPRIRELDLLNWLKNYEVSYNWDDSYQNPQSAMGQIFDCVECLCFMGLETKKLILRAKELYFKVPKCNII